MSSSVDIQRNYLIRELRILAWSASVQHANLYKKDVERDSKATRKFQEDVISHISQKLIRKYKNGVSEQEHYNHIEELVTYGNEIGGSLLGPDGYKYGVAQKLLNLFLKYYWCLGEIAEPPHCPVDRIVIEKTRLRGRNWTNITQRSSYQEVIEEIKRLAGQESIAAWELREFQRR